MLDFFYKKKHTKKNGVRKRQSLDMLCDRKQLTPPGWVLLGILGGGQKCHFPHPFLDQTSKIHTCFQTWPVGRNYVIIT